MESFSADEPSDAEEAWQRALSDKSRFADGFFNLSEQAEDWVDYLYDDYDDHGVFIEYGPDWQTNDRKDSFT